MNRPRALACLGVLILVLGVVAIVSQRRRIHAEPADLPPASDTMFDKPGARTTPPKSTPGRMERSGEPVQVLQDFEIPLVGPVAGRVEAFKDDMDLGKHRRGGGAGGTVFLNEKGEFLYFREGPEEDYSVMNREEAMRQIEECGYKILGRYPIQYDAAFREQLPLAMRHKTSNGSRLNYTMTVVEAKTKWETTIPMLLLMYTSPSKHSPLDDMPLSVSERIGPIKVKALHRRSWYLYPWDEKVNYSLTIEVDEEAVPSE